MLDNNLEYKIESHQEITEMPIIHNILDRKAVTLVKTSVEIQQ